LVWEAYLGLGRNAQAMADDKLNSFMAQSLDRVHSSRPPRREIAKQNADRG
jgi:hypothetical protein